MKFWKAKEVQRMDRSNFDPQVGDSVRIRSWEDMESEFGIDEDGNIPCKFSFTEYMKDMCGDEFTITKIHDGKYSGHEKGNVMLSVDMLEPIQEEEIDGTEIDDFLSAMRVN